MYQVLRVQLHRCRRYPLPPFCRPIARERAVQTGWSVLHFKYTSGPGDKAGKVLDGLLRTPSWAPGYTGTNRIVRPGRSRAAQAHLDALLPFVAECYLVHR